ncbi:polycystic kidney disease protein 1-like 2 [Astyanax mexicanus]|uniref:Polycystic kidney disease protein 1-like 2 n=1 Tax=Astyanax mexicanus TaxID=7994 RepID=A0A8T2LAQ1_ASTMX|nr:polycystic kidney disease protein 1-like 2 [Astyanax mexicanus]
MAFLRQICVYCWISGGFLLLVSAESCNNDEGNSVDFRGKAKCVLGDVCYELAEEPKTWAQARSACEKRGGYLLTLVDCKVKQFLLNLTREIDVTSGAWWVGEGLMGLYQKNPVNGTYTDNTSEEGSGPLLCTYLLLDPFQLVTTPYCDMTLGYLCTLDFYTQTNSSANERVRREATQDQQISDLLQNMENTITDILNLLKIAQNTLISLETQPVQISHDGKIQYLKTLLNGVTVASALWTNETLDLIVNCTGGILMYSLEQCDEGGAAAEHFEDLLSIAYKIYEEINRKRFNTATGTLIMELATGTLYASTQPSKQLDQKIIGSQEKGPYFQLPSFSAMQSQLPSESVNIQMFDYKLNPLSEESNETITGNVCSLSLKNETSEIKLSNLTELIEIFLPRAEAVDPAAVDLSLTQGFSVITSFNISDMNSTVIVSARPDQNVSLRLLLSQTYQTNISSAHRKTIISVKDDYRWLIHPDMMTGSNGTWHVNITPINYTSSLPLKVSVTVLNFKCVFWDTDRKEWSITGCWVGPKTIPNMTHCMCNHNTFFGSSFFVMPNHVDLSKTAALFATVKENYIVVVVLSAFFFLYLIIAMWAWYADRRALRTRKMTLLEDNHPCSHYNYLLNIQTGHRNGSGTSAKVMMTLEGTEGESQAYYLSDPDKPVFERGGVDMFVLSTPFCLGELQNIKLWHDNSGGHPDWYLNRVTIQDLQNRKVWQFFCSTWLKPKGDSTCKVTFNPAKKNEIASFGNIFQSRTSTGFRDEHIWMSIVDPPRHSPFTRLQRVSCCMSLLLCTMAINIMFWNIPTNEESPVIIKIGSFSLTWQQIMVAVESALLMFPINILIVTIFRNIKPRIPPLPEKSTTNGSSKPPAVSMQTILKDTQDMMNLLSKSPKCRAVITHLKLESSTDLFYALNQVHDVIQIMQGESEGDQHWVHCSRFIFYSMCHLSLLLENVAEKAFPSPEELQQAVNTVHLLLKKAEMVFTSHSVQSTVSVPAKQKNTGCKLPWWFVFVAWALLLGISGVSTFFTLLYGFQYGKESSIRWFITLTLSLFQSIFIIQPMKVVGLAIFFALILRPVRVEEREEVTILLQEQREKCETYCGRKLY